MARIHTLYIHDKNQWGLFSTCLDPFAKNIEVKSVADMVKKVLPFAVGSGYRNLTLIFAGKGARNYQSIGAGTISDRTGNLSLQVEKNRDLMGNAGWWISRLSPCVGMIYLLGIQESLLKSLELVVALSKALNYHVPIVGGRGDYLVISDGEVEKARLSRKHKHSVRILPGVIKGGLSALDNQNR